MSNNPFNVVILAAGLGKRMYSDLPKVLHPIGGKPLLAHVLEMARALNPAQICVVYGHGGERVRQALKQSYAVWAKQEPQLGTGHALLQALPYLDSTWPTLVLYGDVPLTRIETLQRLTLIILTAMVVLFAPTEARMERFFASLKRKMPTKKNG